MFYKAYPTLHNRRQNTKTVATIEHSKDYNLAIIFCGNRIAISFRNQVIFVKNAIASGQCCISYINQSFVLQSKTSNWFLYEMQHWTKMG